MKIYQAIHQVLKEKNRIMTLDEIYNDIIENNLFNFGVKTSPPQHVIRIQIKRRSFNSNYKDKSDEVLFYQHDKIYYGLYEWMNDKDKTTHSLLVDTSDTEDEEYSPNAELLDTSLFLEQEWHRWLYKNLEINGLEGLGFGKLSLYDPKEQEHKIGKYNTGEVGEIDLLLKNHNSIIVVELTRKGVDETVGQICRYVGWVEEHLKKKNEKVYGVIIAQDIDKKLEYAIKPIKDHIFYQQIKMNIELGESSYKKEN